jgi:hypothetical protein
MKRRSARPFTVEVKHTRTSRASLTDATARSRKGHDLWRGIPLGVGEEPSEVKPVLPAPVVHSEPVQPKAPAPRVLPSLVPTFSMPVEPEVPEVRAVPDAERLPRVRRVKPPAEPVQTSAARIGAGRKPRAGSTAQPQVTPAAVPAPIATSGVEAQPAAAQARTARRTQPAATLRAGERWKRRLPRVLW